MNVNELKKELHETVLATEPIELEDLEAVNAFSRLETMKEKTRELIRTVSAFVEPDQHEKFHRWVDEYEHLALDWVHSGEIYWEGSLADAKSKKMVEALRPRDVAEA